MRTSIFMLMVDFILFLINIHVSSWSLLLLVSLDQVSFSRLLKLPCQELMASYIIIATLIKLL